MTVRTCLLAGWLGCMGAVGPVPAANAQSSERAEPGRINFAEPETLTSSRSNQKTAEAVAASLSSNSKLKGYRIDVIVAGGVAELQGQVQTEEQRLLALATAKVVPGVTEVRDRLIVGRAEIVPAAQEIVPGSPASPFPPAPQQLVSPMNPGFGAPPVGVPPAAMPGGFPTDPVASHQGHPGMMPNPQYQPPPLPPYAWPTYAPHNNYSRVAHPKLYSHNQWPFIGPMYPYPKIPLGWRRITLEWQDGSWWYGRESNGHDWWRVRYW